MPKAFGAEESERIRRRLLEVGREQLSATGFRKTTVGAIARGAGISKGGFYLFFESKVALWSALLGEVEAQLRVELLALVSDRGLGGEACLREVLRALFVAVSTHPMLRALADPDDMVWLLRALPEGALAEARRDDDRFFGELFEALRARGAVCQGASSRVFAALPAAALAMEQGRGLIGEDRHGALVDFQIEAWVLKLREGSRGQQDS